MDKTSMELFNEAVERGDTVGHQWQRLHDERQLDLMPPAPQPVTLCLSLDGHKLGVVKLMDGEFSALCSCGGKWTFKASENTRTMEAIFTAHVSFSKREAMKTL